jgi:hypothetical protein
MRLNLDTRLALGAYVAILVLALTACGGSGASPAPSPPSNGNHVPSTPSTFALNPGVPVLDSSAAKLPFPQVGTAASATYTGHVFIINGRSSIPCVADLGNNLNGPIIDFECLGNPFG